jgi:uncharacterized protein
MHLNETAEPLASVSDRHEDEPVTVVVTRQVIPGKESDYEAWLERLIQNSRALPGYLGTSIQRPGASGPRTYTSVFRFATVAHLRAFESSDLRRKALLEVSEMVTADAQWNELSGLEFWFTPPAGMSVPQPVRWRMALVMIGVVYLLVLSIGSLVAKVLVGAPIALRLLVTITIEVFLMTYVIMPRLTRGLARWLYR